MYTVYLRKRKMLSNNAYANLHKKNSLQNTQCDLYIYATANFESDNATLSQVYLNLII